MKVRGKAAFSISTDESCALVRMNADLLHGAQLDRSDGLLFTREALVETVGGCFKGSLKAILEPSLAGKYLKRLEETTAKAESPSASLSIVSGKLQIDFPVTPADRKSWIKARSGNRYILLSAWLALKGQEPSFGAGLPPLGSIASLHACLIFQPFSKH